MFKIIFCFFIVSSSYAKNTIQNILALNSKKALSILKKNPDSSFASLKQIFRSRKYSEDLRWKALMLMARLNPKKTKPHALRALKTKNWFLKNAGLVAMEIINPKEAVFFSHLFLNDPSLIVRTASVEILRKYRAVQYKNSLWKSLHAKENFRNGKSLWIRKNIARALIEFSDPKDIHRLIQDSDPDIRQMAFQATSYQYAGKKRSTKTL